MRKLQHLTITILCLTSFFITPIQKAHALTVGEAFTVVGISTLSGAALGASTLPFYSSGSHTQNVWFGAAMGAVVGVFISAYAGFHEGAADAADSENDAFRTKFYTLPEDSYAVLQKPKNMLDGRDVMAWMPVAQVRW